MKKINNMSLLKDKKIVYEYNVDHTEGLVEVIEKIPDDLFNKLKKIIKNKSVKVNSALAGQIEEEYEINDAVPFFEKFLLEKIINNKKLMTDCNARYQILDKNLPIYLRRMWVNYQKKHEFNPVHKHDGIFTFILFIDIPYTIEEQHKISPGRNSNGDKAAHLEFININSMGLISTTTLPIDKKYNQSGFIFPSALHHQVYPFYGVNKPRITVSGNFYLRT